MFFFLAARCRLPSPQSRPSKSRDSKSNTEDEETRKATPTFSIWMVGQKLNKGNLQPHFYSMHDYSRDIMLANAQQDMEVGMKECLI